MFPFKLKIPSAKLEFSLNRVFEKEKGGDQRELGMMVDSISIISKNALNSSIFTKGWLPANITEESLLLVEKGEIMLFNLKRESGEKFVVFFFEPQIIKKETGRESQIPSVRIILSLIVLEGIRFLVFRLIFIYNLSFL